MMEQTLAIIKPDGIKNIMEIINILYQNNLKIEDYKITKLDEEILKEHYSHIADKPFYPYLRDFMMSSEVVVMILSGENAIEKLRTIMGPTDSTKAPKDTIRGMFGTDITINTIHGSDSTDNAKIEINRFFKKEKSLRKINS